MTTTYRELDNLFAETWKEICDLAKTKRKEYAAHDDALNNFRRDAKDLDLTMEQIWRVFAGKHWGAINNYISGNRELSEPIDGRIHDLIVYLVLLKAIIHETGRRSAEPVRNSPPPLSLAVGGDGDDGSRSA